MAHFAQLDEDNIVIKVIVVHNNELLDENGVESEEKGISFCQSLFGGVWKQTSYNGSFRKNYAGVGYKYDEDINAFIPPQPFLSWILNDEKMIWEPPTPMPLDGKYIWNENNLQWESI